MHGLQEKVTFFTRELCINFFLFGWMMFMLEYAISTSGILHFTSKAQVLILMMRLINLLLLRCPDIGLVVEM